MKVVIDENIPFIKGILEPFFEVLYREGQNISAEDVNNADALIVRTRTRCDAGLLEGSSVRFIGTATIGYDHIDTDYCRRNGIVYETAAGCNARAVMQYTASALVHLSRVQNWIPQNKTVGIIGVGNVGSCVKWFAEKCGFRVLCCDPPKQEQNLSLPYVELGELLDASDIISMHVPLIRDGRYRTYLIADENFFRRMREEAVFINTSRGEIVDETALQDAITSGRVSAAVLDVWNKEPQINAVLAHETAYSTPHIAGYSLQGKANGTAIIINKLSRFFGLPLRNWYPEVPCIEPDENITWEYICDTIDEYFNIQTESARLLRNIANFETIRNNYDYRSEYF
ncbi:MAG: 4-phosphoerythronate dehydrogenase [Rikenellaceae bacterium]|nr:4-phosphoerythronate dehydrogenase [Rikenellaceae bacterium]